MEYKTIINDFNNYMDSTTNTKLSNVQLIVNFYFWIKKLDKKYEPFRRHVRAAKKLNDWAKGNLEHAYRVIISLSEYMDNRSLNFTLDTIYRNVVLFEAGVIDACNEETSNHKKAMEYERKRSQQLLAEFHKEQEQEEKKRKKAR